MTRPGTAAGSRDRGSRSLDERAERRDAAGPGRLVAIGGLTERGPERDLLRLFYEAAGGADANLVVLALAAPTSEPAEIRDLSPLAAPAVVAATAERFGDVFYDLGAESVEVLRLGAGAGRSRLDLLEHATGLFLAGGGSSWLPLPDGIPLAEVVRRRHAAGMAVGGNGAGAAILAEQCIAPATASGAGRRRPLGLAPGLGLLPGLLLDPAQRQRDRLSRLLAALALDPTLLAVGLDEDTAVLVDPAATLEVRGAGAAMVVDTAEAVRPGPPLATGALPMLGLRLDLLTAGCRYDLRQRRSRPGIAHGARISLPAKTGGKTPRNVP